MSQVGRHEPVVPSTQEAEAGDCLTQEAEGGVSRDHATALNLGQQDQNST